MGKSQLEELVYASFIGEINALKPGNVSRFADGHGMRYEDFVLSATLCTPMLCNADLGVGERLFRSVELTMSEVGCNTNLGMLLLFLPVIKAYETNSKGIILQKDIKNVLQHLDQIDADFIYQGISLAKPGGLGEVDEHDVNLAPKISLLEAMRVAMDRDMIALQYTNCYSQLYETGINCMALFDKRWNSVEWSSVACFLSFLAEYPDSHIRRKFGEEVAEQVRIKAIPLLERFKKNKNPEQAEAELLEFDRELKDAHINPGTSADMTAASLLLYSINSAQAS